MLDLVKETVEELMAAHAPPPSAEEIAQEEQSEAEDRIKLAQASGVSTLYCLALLPDRTSTSISPADISVFCTGASCGSLV